MTQYKRMIQGLVYDPGDPGIMKEQVHLQDRLWEFNQLKPSDYKKWENLQ
jgi:galactoside O-acetyltransferase